jgi:hypothetical protein
MQWKPGFGAATQSVVEQIEKGLAERAVMLANVERDRAYILSCCSRSDGVRPSRWTMISLRLNADPLGIQTGEHIRRPRWSFGEATAELMQHADGGGTGSVGVGAVGLVTFWPQFRQIKAKMRYVYSPTGTSRLMLLFRTR